jgi:hypothetical protein
VYLDFSVVGKSTTQVCMTGVGIGPPRLRWHMAYLSRGKIDLRHPHQQRVETRGVDQHRGVIGDAPEHSGTTTTETLFSVRVTHSARSHKRAKGADLVG